MNNEDNNLEQIADELKKVAKKVLKAALKVVKLLAKPLIIILVIALIVALIVPIIIKDNAKYKENDESNTPYAAEQFINNVTIDENGNITTELTAQELWDKLVKNGSNVNKYLSGPDELLRLMNAQIVTNYPDTRQNPDDEINWDELNEDVESNKVQGIIKIKRADSSGHTSTMTYADKETFYDWIEEFNADGDESARNNLLTHYTLEKSVTSTASQNTTISEESGEVPQVADTKTSASDAIVKATEEVPSPGANLCQKWVRLVYQKAGLGNVNYSTAIVAYDNCKVSDDKTNIPVGATVYGTGSGSGAGHVGIYIGNGQVRDNINGSIKTSSLEDWIEWQERRGGTHDGKTGWLGWGWQTKKAASVASVSNVESSFTKFELTEAQLKAIATVCQQEQGSAKGAAAEASLMANHMDLDTGKAKNYPDTGEGLYNYVKNGGWFAKSKSFMDTYKTRSGEALRSDVLEAVRAVLVEGKRTLPGYIDEHDSLSDIASISTGSKTNRSDYKQDQTIIKQVARMRRAMDILLFSNRK